MLKAGFPLFNQPFKNPIFQRNAAHLHGVAPVYFPSRFF